MQLLDQMDHMIVLAEIDEKGRYKSLDHLSLKSKLVAVVKLLDKGINTIVFSEDQPKRAAFSYLECRVIYASDYEDLKYKYRNTPRPGCKIQEVSLPQTSETPLFGRKTELKLLDKAWREGKTNILILVAMGGAGKTALIKHWLENMRCNDWHGAENVITYSFYNQGTDDKSQLTAQDFFNDALKSLKYKGNPLSNDAERAQKLAELVANKRTLLVLDGLEPLQNTPGLMRGSLKDKNLQNFLVQLGSQNQGLCLITTRLVVRELLRHNPEPFIISHDLEKLQTEDGIKLLRYHEIKGTDKELAKAVKDFGNHALALTILGSYIKTVHGGNILQRYYDANLQKEVLDEGGHAQRVMSSYEHWLKKNNQEELSVLYLMGLFDRPASAGAIQALLDEPIIPKLTNFISRLSKAKWSYALKHLRDLYLINPVDPRDKDSIDVHPMVRDYFREKLKSCNPETWRSANKRLYNYYKNLPDKELPDTLEEMEPLVAAIAHGSQAGLHQKAFDEIYWKRLHRGKNRYLIFEHGAYGMDLMCLRYLCDTPWTKPAKTLNDDAQITVLNYSGFALRAAGYLPEARENLQTVLQKPWIDKSPKTATISACNLSHLNIHLGNFKDAIEYSKFAVENSMQYPEKIWDTAALTTLADAYHQTGKIHKAKCLFEKAEKLHIERYDGVHILHAMQEYRYCELLRSVGKWAKAEERTQNLLEKGFNQKSLLYRSLTLLSLGKSLESNSNNLITEAVDLLRRASHDEFLPYGLLARAALSRQSDSQQAILDLKEVYDITMRSALLPYRIDCHLETAQLILSIGEADGVIILDKSENAPPTTAKDHIQVASDLIDKTGYNRRKPNLALVRAQLSILKCEQTEARHQLDIVFKYIDDGWKIHEFEFNELNHMLDMI